ncbi:MAG: LUD domain-containing protein [Peptococcaceae bacterium]|nr:LUD domain-containing protein [Peptococcaceae bacterium]
MSTIKENINAYAKDINEASEDERIRTAITRAIASYRKNLADALERYPHTPALAKEVQDIKKNAHKHWRELMAQAMDSIERNHGHAYFAEDAQAVVDIINEIAGGTKTIVKGKSMLGEEIHLRQRLSDCGHEVWETDLGEFILQLMDGRPMHILSPSIHVPREQVAEVFSEFFCRDIKPDIAEEVMAVREFLREKYFTADIGISGANAVAADTGQITIIENEGNVRLCTAAPPVHIAVVGIEKIVPSFLDSMKVAEVNWRYGQYTAPAYVNIISGPSKTGDIEKVTTYGAHGPHDFHVIFVDNGRSKMIDDPVCHDAALCLRCGGCMYECPVFSLVAGHFGKTYMNGIGAIWTAFVDDTKEAAPIVYNCLRCGRCVEQCPMDIDVPTMIYHLRTQAVAEADAKAKH